MTATNEDDDFYEDDEPVEKIQAAFQRGEKGVTKRPRDLNRLAASVVEDAVASSAPGVRFDHLRLERHLESAELKIG